MTFLDDSPRLPQADGCSLFPCADATACGIKSWNNKIVGNMLLHMRPGGENDMLLAHCHTITQSMLNDAYGDRGRTYHDKAEAEAAAAKHPGAFVARLRDGTEGAYREIGWLVTFPVSYRPRFGV